MEECPQGEVVREYECLEIKQSIVPDVRLNEYTRIPAPSCDCVTIHPAMGGEFLILPLGGDRHSRGGRISVSELKIFFRPPTQFLKCENISKNLLCYGATLDFQPLLRCGENRWCGQGDLNPHGLLHSILSAVRLPISPWPLSSQKHIIKMFSFQLFYVIIIHIEQRKA